MSFQRDEARVERPRTPLSCCHMVAVFRKVDEMGAEVSGKGCIAGVNICEICNHLSGGMFQGPRRSTDLFSGAFCLPSRAFRISSFFFFRPLLGGDSARIRLAPVRARSCSSSASSPVLPALAATSSAKGDPAIVFYQLGEMHPIRRE